MSDEPKLPLKKLLEVDAQIDQQAREYVELSGKLRSYNTVWQELPGFIHDWIAGQDELGVQLSSHLRAVRDITISRFDDPDCIVRVAAFVATPYESEAANTLGSAPWLRAIAVEFILRVLTPLSNDAFVRNTMAALSEYQELFASLSNRGRAQIASSVTYARYVIQRGEICARCRRCNKPIDVACFDRLACVGCNRTKEIPSHIKEQIDNRWANELLPMTGKTKADAIGTGGSVTKWLDCQVRAFNALLSHLKAGAIDCQRAARRAEEIARLTEWKLKHGELPIAEWRAEAVVIYCDLMAHVLTSETEKTKTRLLDMLEFNSAHSNAETVQLAPIGQLNTMIGIKSENVYGMGGTFKGELPEEWLSQTDGEPPAGDGSANAGRSQLKFRDLSDLSDKFKVHETPSDACGRQLSATSGNTSLGTGHKEPPAYKKGQNWIRQTVLNDIIFNATNRLATAKTKGFHADDNSWGVAQNKRTWRVERRAVFYYVPWLPRDEKDLVKKSQNPNRSRS